MPRPDNVRASAARLLHKVADRGHSLDAALAGAPALPRDQALLHELTIGAVRHYFSLQDELDTRLHEPLKPRDAILKCLLMIGAYQLRHTRIPSYAAVNETVAAARTIGRPWARGLLNQVLRAIARSAPPAPTNDAARWDHPDWLIARIRTDYPDWQDILRTNLSRAPLALRVNTVAISRENYAIALSSMGVSAHSVEPDSALVLTAPMPVAQLPGYAEGRVSVQDPAAQWAAPLLMAKPHQRVLDACAAPGGKALHMLELAPDIELVALDRDADRCDAMRAECARLHVDPACVRQGDAAELTWWDRAPFDRILLDAPCSGSGTLRRHPDIKLLKHESDLVQYHGIQSRLLRNLWQTLGAGGCLLYCTCSILSVENDDVIEAFLAVAPDAVARPIELKCGQATRFGWQILPAEGGPDGFYYAMLEKR
jgi:16S rRNA (cytosine967-C5)-methyltransferase